MRSNISSASCLLAAVVLSAAGCGTSGGVVQAPGVVIGCPSPGAPFEEPETLTDSAAVTALASTVAFCDDELVKHPDDEEFQERLKLQEEMERLKAKAEADKAKKD